MKYNNLSKKQLIEKIVKIKKDHLGFKSIQTKYNRWENEIHMVNRALNALTNCSKVIINAKKEKDILNGICQIIVKEGGYCFAWVGFPEQNKEKNVRPVAKAGHDNGYLATIKITWSNTKFGRGPTGTTIRTGKISINKNALQNPLYTPWVEAAKKCCYKSSVALPLKNAGHTFGALNIYAAEINAFNGNEVRLLKHLSDGLAYGIVALRTLDKYKKREQKIEEYYQNMEEIVEETIQAIASTVETRDLYTAGHQRHVAKLAFMIAKNMDLSEKQIKGIYMAGLIHDLGKIHIPAEILSKPSKLDKMEYGIVKTHPKIAYDILKTIKFPWPIAEIILQHHERINGSGYPLGLSGKNIRLESKILSVADVVEAMASHRPYRPSLGIKNALKEIKNNRKILYDSKVVDICIRLYHDRKLSKKFLNN